MKKFVLSKIPFIIVLALCGIFNVVFWPVVATKIDIITLSTWLSYGFMMLAFLVVALIAFFLRLKTKNVMTAILPFFYTCVGYLLISIGLNTILMACNRFMTGDLYIVSLIINIVFLLIAGIILLIIFKTFARVNDNTIAREERMAAHRLTFVDVNSLIELTEDEEIKSALKDLKDDVNYSSSRSSDATKELDEQFNKEVSAIEGMLTMDTDKAVILGAIKKAKLTWRKRNQVAMISRR